MQVLSMIVEVEMPEMTRFDILVLITVGSVFIVGLWSMVFAFMYGFQKRLDRIIILLQEQNNPRDSE